MMEFHSLIGSHFGTFRCGRIIQVTVMDRWPIRHVLLYVELHSLKTSEEMVLHTAYGIQHTVYSCTSAFH